MGNMYRCQRFRAYLRRLEFLNPVDMRTVCRSLGEGYELSEHLKNFTYLARQNKTRPSSFRPIPITKKEAETQESEENMSKARDFAENRTVKYIGSETKNRKNHCSNKVL